MVDVRSTDDLTEENVNNLSCYKQNEQTICGWTWEVLVRVVLTVIFGLSALLIEPFMRFVEGKLEFQIIINLNFI